VGLGDGGGGAGDFLSKGCFDLVGGGRNPGRESSCWVGDWGEA
jgi:hypothetical protein